MLLSVRKVIKNFPVSRGLLGTPLAFLKAVDDVSFDMSEGQITGVVGESGCGKSTLGRCVVGLYEPTEGTVSWDGQMLDLMDEKKKKSTQRRFQMVFQNPFASLNPRQKVKDILLEPLEVHDLFKEKDRLPFVKELLSQVGLSTDDLLKYPHEFSGGQRQRVGLARALVCQPELIVLDEPVSSLDVSVQASILNLLARFNREKRISYLFISHDLQVVGYLSERILVMYLGRIVEEGDTDKVLKKPGHPYTQILLAASEGQKVHVKGEPPSPVNTPSGCAFHTRCPYAEKRCQEEKQELVEMAQNWRIACWKWNRL
jgi:oligopeptide/dipeptide ABC transporter ATP-binding protein